MKKTFFIIIVAIFFFLGAPQASAEGASLYVVPSKGTFLAGSTFSLSVYLDTKGSKVNAVEVDLIFSPEILQVTTPTAGKSFIAEWAAPPSYSNAGGIISFKGGIPGGIITSSGLVSTVTFRAKSPGQAWLKILKSSKVFLNDGKGTPIFTANIEGAYDILTPPPEGPEIFSASHPDSDIWYSNSSPVFSWEKKAGASDFSFSFSENSQENPDTASEGQAVLKSYDNVSDGVWYFHLREKENGVWGRTSHFAVKIDTSPPQNFELKTDTYSGLVYFQAQDLHSGVDHYEISAQGLEETGTEAKTAFFIEGTSPYKIPFKEAGKYIVVVRAYDKAGNYQQQESRFQLVFPFISFIEGRGVQIKGLLVSWPAFWLILFLILAGFLTLIFYLLKRRGAGFRKGIEEIREALAEIKKIEEKEKETQGLKEKFKEEKEKLEQELGKQDFTDVGRL